MPPKAMRSVSCGVCRDPDNSRMVCCDECGLWFHFECVGVNEDIEERDWSCSECVAKRSTQIPSVTVTNLARDGTDSKSKGEQEQAKQLSEFQKKLDQMQTRFDEQQRAYQVLLEEKDRELLSVVKELKSQFECRLAVREREIREELSVPIAPPTANSTVVGRKDNRSSSEVETAMAKLERQLAEMSEKQEQQTRTLEERIRAMEINRSRSNLSDADPNELSRSQLAARHAVSKELPTFSGNPEEWPLFISTYESSTRMCGFSDEENLLRLQRSLRGRALETVRSRLLHPVGLEGVIKTLRMLYGRPEVIVNTLVGKIREMPAPKTEKLGTLIDFGVAVQNMCATIVACGLNEHLCNVALLQELVERLPPTVKLDWAKHRQTLKTVTLEDFSKWLETLVEAACVVTIPSTVGVYTSKPERRVRKEEVHVHLQSNFDQASIASTTSTVISKKTGKPCVICQGECSSVGSCRKFQRLEIGARWAALKQNKLCRKCLAKHFGACAVKRACGRNGCSYMHHELLHDDFRYQKTENSRTSDSRVAADTVAEHCNTHVSYASKVLFRYVPVILHGRGKSVRTFAFLDEGSSATLMEHSLLRELDLDGEPYPLCLGWTGDHQRHEMSSVMLAMEISGVRDTEIYRMPKVHTVESLALPQQTLSMAELALDYIHLENVPADSYCNVQPRILIGMDNCRLGSALDSREGGKVEPIAARTRLGWIVFGPCSKASQPSTNFTAHHSFHVCPCCERRDADLHGLVKAYMSLDSTGVTSSVKPLLSKDDERAEQLLRSLTCVKGKRMETGLLWRYDDVRLPDSKSMAMRRLVCLEKRMQRDPELAESVKQKLRDYERAGYIEKLTKGQLAEKFDRVWYLPIFPVVNPNKPKKMRLVWDAAAKVSGVSLNSFLLTGPDQLTSLVSVLQRFREFRIAITVFISVETEEEAIQLAKDVRHVHAEAGFEIRNWLSNSNRVLQQLEANPGEKSLNLSSEMATEKVLGLWWCTATDTFTFKISPRINAELLQGGIVPTKRQILSTLMTIYDPLGLLAHFLMFLKILQQEIWRSGVSWDEPIKNEQFEKWQTWLHVLPQVESVSVPRCYRMKTSLSDRNAIQLHVFVDASENGFAAVAYLRFEEDGEVDCVLIRAKTRVAPLRFVSIPRLELQAAVIGARLANDVMETHKLKPAQRFFWTDSRNVLCWLNSDHRKYNPFVAVRISEMLELTETSEWNWVPTKLNIADEATKWQKLPDLSPTSRWFRGPDFLWGAKKEWPVIQSKFEQTAEEKRPHVLHHSVERALFRGPLTQEEFEKAELFILQSVQDSEFDKEKALLLKPKPLPWKHVLPKSSLLYKLSPFIGGDGLLRMKGRIDECTHVEECTKHPILLPKQHPVTDLIIASIHQKFCHMNHQTTLNEIRRRFYVPGLKSAYKRVRERCQLCKIRQVKPEAPEMSGLPSERLQAFCRPFSYVGIDYFGPIESGKTVVTCLTMRAVHLEVAHSLTTDSCILAIRNFIARRGTPVQIVSDRGTNFIGASRELKEALQQVNQDKLMDYFVTPDTKWSFNPPASPHFGGVWERLVQSVKKALKHLQVTRTPTDEILRNTLTEIELIINSRPLTELPLNDEFSQALTPNDILIGSSDGSKPPIAYDDSSYAVKHTWKMSQVYANRFWRRWIAEFLPTLTRRTKWFNRAKPIAEGDIVVIVDDALPRNCWPKGRVVRAVRSKDGQVRRAVVQTAHGILERPAVKLAVLDVGANVGTSNR
ncbi:uncharacterized protein LOC128739741 [Sabethes cyaneus]|uniref:uncharacterized protein LOC128739741 n=1 Tax=Sabethes cyaneus TaxID=53552 RepID=UPI00237E7D73|nr:uncharacterized protein LOC128739741 [Sabethes cyaneus]